MNATLIPGANTQLPYGQLTVLVQHGSNVLTDLAALLLTNEGKVRSDGDFVYFNNVTGEGVQWSKPFTEGGYQIHQITIDPSRWNSDIAKLMIALTIDDDCPGKKFSDVQNLQAEIRDANGNVVTTLDLGRPTTETGFLVAEIYLHNGSFKIRCVGQGYDTGLRGIMADHGLEEEKDGAQDTQPVVQDAPPVVQDAPPVVQNDETPKLGSRRTYDLIKPINGSTIDMQKYEIAKSLVDNEIDGIKARVILVIDSSGSMEYHNPPLFSGGVVQRSLERVVPIADMLDDDHKMEVWFFGSREIRSETVKLETMANYIHRNKKDKKKAGWDNNEPKVIRDIVKWVKKNPSEYPTLVLFWSDGGVDKDAEIERLIRESADLPIFWMFLGLGRANYGILRRLDGLSGRYVNGVDVDNTGFKEIDDIERKEDSWLYDIIISNMAKWVRAMIAARKLDGAGRVVR
ncbi:VWA domain-containing protein [Shimazuella kribbensis]|uniref:VWA domain-containing protein n=1 Tax=Shimazuella kribbensis TaxID=139808 RepID=UPI0004915E9E|nr:VWA domain-containing protein [Shimazuella kribbensis]